jgi:hypothetical protein
MGRTNAIRQSVAAEPLLCQALRAQAAALRTQADLLESLAMANASGDNSDLLKSSDVQKLLNCGPTKACEILRAHGFGSGKMARIERGLLMQLQRDGKLSGKAG